MRYLSPLRSVGSGKTARNPNSQPGLRKPSGQVTSHWGGSGVPQQGMSSGVFDGESVGGTHFGKRRGRVRVGKKRSPEESSLIKVRTVNRKERKEQGRSEPKGGVGYGFVGVG